MRVVPVSTLPARGMGERGLLGLFFPEKSAQRFVLIILLFLFFPPPLHTCDCVSSHFRVLWKRPSKITSTKTSLPGCLLACLPALGLSAGAVGNCLIASSFHALKNWGMVCGDTHPSRI